MPGFHNVVRIVRSVLLALLPILVVSIASADRSPIMIYRGAASSMGTNNGVSFWLYRDGEGGDLTCRLMSSDGRALGLQPVYGSGEDTEPLWPKWNSNPISLATKGWVHVIIPESQFVYEPAVNEQPQAQPAGKFSDIDTFGLVTSRRKGKLFVDDVRWVTLDQAGTPTNTGAVVDDFETGDVASWRTHGTPEALSSMVYGVTTYKPAVKQGAVSFKLDWIDYAKNVAMAKESFDRALLSSEKPLFVWVPTSPYERVLPDTVPSPRELNTSVETFGCAAQTVSGSFCVYSDKELSNVTVSTETDLMGIGRVIPASDVSIFVVKAWEKLGGAVLRDSDAKGFYPELLVKDDRAKLDLDGSYPPAVRLTGAPVADIPAKTEKQFWVRIKIPDGTAPGDYSCQLVITSAETPAVHINLGVNVLGLRLLSPSKQYAINFTGILDPNATAPGPESALSTEQYSAQLEDIANHGFRYATITQGPDTLGSAVDLYKAAGLASPIVYSCLRDPSPIDRVEAVEQARRASQDDPFYYLVPPGDLQDKSAATVRRSGSLVGSIVASSNSFDALKNDLDLVIYPEDEPYVQKLLRTGGQRSVNIRDWWVWPSAQVDPQIARLYSGFLLWRSDLYGAFVSDYESTYGADPYDEASTPTDAASFPYRPAMMTYPAAGGVIDTVQWEAAREGVNDVRYLTTMYAAMRECKDNHVAPALVLEASTYVNNLLGRPLWGMTDADYQDCRRHIAHYAVLLRQQVDSFYKAHPSQ